MHKVPKVPQSGQLGFQLQQQNMEQQGGSPKFLCGPDKDFVPAAHFARLESIFDNPAIVTPCLHLPFTCSYIS